MKDRSDERESFLKYLSDIYLHNSDVPIHSDTIYYELSKFVNRDGEQYKIGNESLLGVQIELNNRFKNNNHVNTFTSSNGYFWIIENRMGKTDHEFLSDICNSIKLYISVDSSNICKISENLFNFMINEGIVMQCKVAKNIRNDALVCRVGTKEAAISVSKYLNDLGYTSGIKCNPFIFDNGQVGISVDGRLSYNDILSKLIGQYLQTMRNFNSLEGVSCDGFNDFIKGGLKLLRGNRRNEIFDLYRINSDTCDDFIKVLNIISDNLENNFSFDRLSLYQETKSTVDVINGRMYSIFDENKMLCVINRLAGCSKYNKEDVHLIIMRFIQTGNYNLFTRFDDRREPIRSIIYDNFSSEDVRNIISNIGWKAFITASKVTYDKYGESWLLNAVDKYLKTGQISGFTREQEARGRLGLVIPPELLRQVITYKLEERGMPLSSASLTDLMLEEIGKLDDNKKVGRK